MTNENDSMDKLVNSIADKGPAVLWHYTTPEGLLGILRSGQIFATGLPYLNDSTEGSYMTDLTLARLAEKMPPRMAEAVRIPMAGLSERSPLAVACFCSHGDLLGQWRAYAGGRGFAIGFDTKMLSNYWTVTQKLGLLASVQYKNKKSHAAAERYADVIRDAWEELVADGIKSASTPPTESEVETVAKGIFEFSKRVGYLGMSGAFHKPRHFAEEREWRFVTALSSRTPGHGATDTEEFDERATSFGIAVYRRVAFQDNAQTSPIRSIRIGPGLNVESQLATIERVLGKYGYSGIEIDGSTVPLRF